MLAEARLIEGEGHDRPFHCSYLEGVRCARNFPKKVVTVIFNEGILTVA